MIDFALLNVRSLAGKLFLPAPRTLIFWMLLEQEEVLRSSYIQRCVLLQITIIRYIRSL